ncbi:BTB/POZ domain-containing protein POB1-like [Heracleum sosnowskyi]|uniref:BTB/POZ domain-containing protein POB1-like n=1 Tax=Heracleum sosnowskyi TaxID=360622 RepID=A0AAD8JDC7_9APIA|nr:BTB/POZ domain-containing protein POB1-like [Heracleum sosnowskyi]
MTLNCILLTGLYICLSDSDHHLVERRYKYQVVRIIDYAFPLQKCEMFMDLKRRDCEELFTIGRVDPEVIHLGGQGFFLSMQYCLDPQRSYPCFGLFLGKVERGSSNSSIKYEFSAMMSSTEEHACDHKAYCILPRGKAVGYRKFFGLHWKDFISDDLYFINDVLHIKCVLTMQQ